MEREVFTLPKVKELFAKFVIVGLKTDIKNKRINELYAKYKDAEDPTIPLYVVLDHDEKSLGFIHATLGPEPKGDEDNGPPPSAFVKFLETMAAKNVTGDKPVDPATKPNTEPKAEMKQGSAAERGASDPRSVMMAVPSGSICRAALRTCTCRRPPVRA